MLETTTPTLGPIKRTVGVAGQVAYSVEVTYPGEEPRPVTFVGSTSGGPVVMVTRSALVGEVVQTFVSEPAARFGTFGPRWVRRFFGVEEV